MRALTLLLAALPLLLLPACSSPGSQKTEKPRTPAATTPPPRGSAPAWAKGMKTVTEDKLPPEARRTLELIAKGGPFPYDKDGTVFGNYENRLPKQARGYYHEYTVPTPGARNRGARRIITGEHSERYYTGDHYETFEAVVHP
ncbi:ribonuclease domain-containing protein [Streptomyces sp. UNOB3_S3]|uniref:ribonuclease domain-containing protein n=1 Tax=Streptomyces sp. UNOB3_S3 TaxID=2871682 RepID=UPI001E4CABC1|nr:ribonuclease domain-containing protein [Streptomyces sp. UNOB3_S3]MCC3778833.1 guanine-specific ribonuclease N1 and T1 [Streptomyces sp. UNOB3_S3]